MSWYIIKYYIYMYYIFNELCYADNIVQAKFTRLFDCIGLIVQHLLC